MKRGLSVSSPWFFFALVFGLTWLFWIPAVLSGQGFASPLTVILLALGLLIPVAVDCMLLYLTKGREGWRDFWTRLVDFRRISAKWYGVVLLSSPLFAALAILTHVLLGGSTPSFETLLKFLAHPLTILPFGIYILVAGPLPEELGWRGYVLDRLQAKYNALVASLVLGVFWGLWHLPLFFIEGTYQHDKVGTFSFWLNFSIGILASSILMTWIYNNTRRSTLSAVLYHFMINFTGEFLALPAGLEYYETLWSVVAAAVVIALWGPKTLTGRIKMGETLAPN